MVSTVDDPLPLADGLMAALQNQLDIGSIYGPPSLEVFVNEAWFPVGAQLTGVAAAASKLAGEDVLARADLSGAPPSMIGADRGEPRGANEVAPGVLHLAIPFDQRIELRVGDETIAPRPGFGVTTAFDIESNGTGMLGYRQDPARAWWRAVQLLLWLVVLTVAAGARSPFGRRRGAGLHDETLIDLSDAPTVTGAIVGEALGLPAWSDDSPDDVLVFEPHPDFGADAGDPDPGDTQPGDANPSDTAPAVDRTRSCRTR